MKLGLKSSPEHDSRSRQGAERLAGGEARLAEREPPDPANDEMEIKVACRRYARAVRGLLVCAGWLRASRIPPACDLQWGCVHGMVRWFPLHRCAVSLHHRLIYLCSLREPRPRWACMTWSRLMTRIRRSLYSGAFDLSPEQSELKRWTALVAGAFGSGSVRGGPGAAWSRPKNRRENN
jgi:hypothetical protein